MRLTDRDNKKSVRLTDRDNKKSVRLTDRDNNKSAETTCNESYRNNFAHNNNNLADFPEKKIN